MKLILATLSLALAACSPQAAAPTATMPAPEAIAPKSQAEARSRIAPGVFSKDSRSDLPGTAAKLGDAFDRIQQVREAAAYRTLDSGRCDYVDLVEVSDTSKSDNIKVFVDCRNGQRFYLDETILAASGIAIGATRP